LKPSLGDEIRIPQLEGSDRGEAVGEILDDRDATERQLDQAGLDPTPLHRRGHVERSKLARRDRAVAGARLLNDVVR